MILTRNLSFCSQSLLALFALQLVQVLVGIEGAATPPKPSNATVSPITTHVLDTSLGKPAANIPVEIEMLQLADDSGWRLLGVSATNADGRCNDLISAKGALPIGAYRITWYTETYHVAHNQTVFYPYIQAEFNYEHPKEHYHIPLLLSPFGYSTYRGS